MITHTHSGQWCCISLESMHPHSIFNTHIHMNSTFLCLDMYLKCYVSVWAYTHSRCRKTHFIESKKKKKKQRDLECVVSERVWSTAKAYTAVYWCAGLCAYLLLYLKLHFVLFDSCMCYSPIKHTKVVSSNLSFLLFFCDFTVMFTLMTAHTQLQYYSPLWLAYFPLLIKGSN